MRRPGGRTALDAPAVPSASSGASEGPSTVLACARPGCTRPHYARGRCYACCLADRAWARPVVLRPYPKTPIPRSWKRYGS